MEASAIILEGGTRLSVPRVSLGAPEPPTAPVFFNPAASVNRDISVAVAQASAGRTFLDALAGVGARGVRVAREVERDMSVTMLDFNSESLLFARRNVRLNGVQKKCQVLNSEANVYLHSRYGRDEKFDCVDVDPFGSPIPFLQGAVRAAADGGMLSLTATDTAVLCGVYPGVSKRRYGMAPLSNHFRHETGLRILMNALRREAASLDIGIRPALAHSTRHYMRVHARIEVGASKADESMANEGFLAECRECFHVSATEKPASSCERCGGRVRVAGPLWTGSIVDDELVSRAAVFSGRVGFRQAAELLGAVEGIGGLPPFSFSVENVCSALRVPSVSEKRVIERLEAQGYRCRKQPFEKTGIKCDCDYQAVREAVRELSRAQRGGARRRGAHGPG